ncbi:MAG: glycoside hydrolase family 99-like domain-containing protein [Acidimicrobiia bacterium]|nr:glycoside hydrolase family 99-like domain-containing protein [Acidimicrobiia bacterium]
MATLAVALVAAFFAFQGPPSAAAGFFTDDDGNTHEAAIDSIAAAEITLGCDATQPLYCPDGYVSRAQMASFIVRAVDLPPTTEDYFTDDSGNTHQANINALAAAGVTFGCTESNYCPADVVTRAQMASFLARAIAGLVPTSDDFFIDDTGSTHEANINLIAANGITVGCAASVYCPGDPVRRDQMASFLARATGLVDPVEPPVPGEWPQPAAPIVAAFFYPWFPEAWDQGASTEFTNYTPSLGFYASDDTATVDAQLELAKEAGIEAFIASWWGQGHHTDDHLLPIMDRTVNVASPYQDMRWSIYYEEEGQSDPSAAQIAADLEYMNDRFFSHDAFLRVEGAPVIFVWADGSDAAGMAARWAEAKALFGKPLHVVLKVFSGYEGVANQPDSWHQYGPAVAYDEQLPHSATVSPGFWLYGDTVRLARDPARFTADVERMAASGAFWQLITTWNEWGEGTSIEPAAEFGNDYLDAVAASYGGSDPVPPVTTTTTSPATTLPPVDPPTGGTVRFTAGGDVGTTDESDESWAGVAAYGGDFHLLLGDVSYSDITPESAWCDDVLAKVGTDIPIQLISGNHEDDGSDDGHINNFAACLPDRMSSQGIYAAEYYFDIGTDLRVIMIGAALTIDGEDYDYDVGNPHYDWLAATIDDARSSGIEWIVVGMHKVCITAGNKPCEIGQDLVDLLIDKRVDLVLHGHDHDYQRSKQLACATENVYVSSCVIDDGADGVYTKGGGTVFVIAGNFGGGGLTDIDPADPEFAYMAATMGNGDAGEGRGYLELVIDDTGMYVEFTGGTATFSDIFRIAPS